MTDAAGGETLEAKVTSREQLREHAWKRLNEQRFVLLTTRDSSGRLESRPMTLQQTEFDSTLWFFASHSSAFVAELHDQPEVNVSCMDTRDRFFVSINGRATIVSDPQRARDLWNVANEAWFPGGPDEPDLALLRVDVESAELWQSETNRMVEFFKIVRAAASGKSPASVGQHTVINP
jgi:general stress protein 26